MIKDWRNVEDDVTDAPDVADLQNWNYVTTTVFSDLKKD